MENPFEKLKDEIIREIGLVQKRLDKFENTTDEKPLEDLISFQELSKLLSAWYTKGSLYHIVNKPNFPKYKKGMKLFFKQKEVEDWITSQNDVIPGENQIIKELQESK